MAVLLPLQPIAIIICSTCEPRISKASRINVIGGAGATVVDDQDGMALGDGGGDCSGCGGVCGNNGGVALVVDEIAVVY
jgi:hypothetical protein